MEGFFMEKIKKNLDLLLLGLLSLIPFVPTFRSIDAIAPQTIYLVIIQVISLIYIFLQKKRHNYSINYIHVSYILFLLFSLLSLFAAENIPEFVIDFLRYVTFFLSFLIIDYLFRKNKNSKYLFICLFIVLSFVEAVYIFNIFLENYTFEKGLQRIRELQGLSYNQNIGAFSLAIKIPVILYVYIHGRGINGIISTILFALLSIIFFDIIVIASRAAILSLIFQILSIFILILFNKYFEVNKTQIKRCFHVILLFLLVLFSQNILYENSQNLKFTERIVNYSDGSVNFRASYYKNAIKGILDSPLIGFGTGNWKIISLKYQASELRSYEVPYHVHNDFLHIGAESGIMAMLSYFLIFVSSFIYLIIRIIQKKELFAFFLLMSLCVFFIDSNINFPRARPYSQMNIIYLFGFISAFKSKDLKIIEIKRIWIVITLIFLFVTFTVHYRVFLSYREQVALYGDFNFFQSNMRTPVEIVEKFEEDFPNITNVCIPIKTAKAQYYLQNKNYEKAKSLLLEGQKINPYTYMTEFGLSKIYFEKGKYDSAYYYGKIAAIGLPKNTSHSTHFQKVLGAIKTKSSLIELDSLFDLKKSNRLEATWQNHLWLTASLKSILELPYTSKDRDISQQAIDIFPRNEIIQLSYQMINLGSDALKTANKFDMIAKNKYEKELYEDAIKNWGFATEIIPNDGAYYLNIIQSMLQLEKYDEALIKLNNLSQAKSNYKNLNDGKLELLKATIYLFKNDFNRACQNLQLSLIQGNKRAEEIFSGINCK